jgi:hypothetical protein
VLFIFKEAGAIKDLKLLKRSPGFSKKIRKAGILIMGNRGPPRKLLAIKNNCVSHLSLSVSFNDYKSNNHTRFPPKARALLSLEHMTNSSKTLLTKLETPVPHLFNSFQPF